MAKLKLNQWYKDKDGVYYAYKKCGKEVWFHGYFYDGWSHDWWDITFFKSLKKISEKKATKYINKKLK